MEVISRSLVEHKLSLIPEARPIRKKKRTLAGERSKVVNEEVDKLVKAKIFRESIFLVWISNPRRRIMAYVCGLYKSQ